MEVFVKLHRAADNSVCIINAKNIVACYQEDVDGKTVTNVVIADTLYMKNIRESVNETPERIYNMLTTPKTASVD